MPCSCICSCIMVHMVKGRQYSANIIQATSIPAPQSLRWSLRLTLNLNTDNFQSQETNSTASEHQVGRSMAHSVRAIYSTRLALFIHGITSAKRTHEVRPAVLCRESSTQLVMYSLDTGTCIRYSTYNNISSLRKAPRYGGPEFSGNNTS